MLLGCGKSQPVSDIDLPRALHAAEFAVPEEGPTPTVKILADGTIFVEGFERRKPLEDYSGVIKALLTEAQSMETVPINFDDVEGPEEGGYRIPANPIVIRADRDVPYRVVKTVLQACNHETIRIWNVRVVALGSESGELGTIGFGMLRDIGISCPAPPISDVALFERAGHELRFWKRSGTASDSPPPPREFRTQDPIALQTYFESFGPEDWRDIWRFDAPDEVEWGNVVIALDSFVAAERGALLPMDSGPVYDR